MKIAQTAPILLSAAFPGIGHIAAGKALRGILLFFLFGFAVDGWVYSQAAGVLPPEQTPLSVPTLRNGSLALGAVLWAFAVLDTLGIALRRRRIAAKAEVADGHIRRALVAYLRSDYQGALKELRSARRIDDQDPDTFFHLGVVYACLGQRRKARNALHRCIRYDHDGKWDTQAQDQLQALDAHAARPSAPAPAEAREEAER